MQPPSSTPSEAPRRGPRTGDEIAGKYRLGDLLGRGGRGEVYAALQVDLSREVAVKVLADSCRDDDERARFVRETRIVAGIRHPCIVEIYDAGVEPDGAPYCVMELLQGETLADRLTRCGPLGPGEAVGVASGLCQALQAVHDKGFLHRDVKPSNVFLARRADGGVDPKLIDFGIAKKVALDKATLRRLTTLRGLGAAKETAMDIIVGTPRYLSPEQILGTKLDARSDVHAMAATLYEMLCGAPPFEAATLGDLLGAIVQQPATPLSERDPALPDALDRAVLRALAKDPAQRPASAADFAASLWSAMATAKYAESSPPPAPSRRRGLGFAVLAGVAVLIAAISVVVIARPPAPAAVSATTAAAAATPASPPASPPEPVVTPSAPEPPSPAPPPPVSSATGRVYRATPTAAAHGPNDLKDPFKL
jgi:serine/threonine-protein kinase